MSEDWDAETPAHSPSHSRHPSHNYPKQSIGTWVEAGPSTPTRRLANSGSAAENWDDDFEDRVDSPVRSDRKSPPTSRITPGKGRTTTATTTTTENWDDEFQFGDSPARSVSHQQFFYVEEGDSEDDDDDADFNALDKDEDDRTVTARSRRAALSRLVSNSSPPPPVPPLPLSMSHLSSSVNTDQPFPRSPSTSVFSVPTSGRDRDSIAAPSYYSYNSTTHLRPTVSRSSAGGLSHLPPSPPIHKDRERRRLRKKSRPQEPGPVSGGLSAAMNSSRESVRSRPVTPQTHSLRSSSPNPGSATTMSPTQTNRNSVISNDSSGFNHSGLNSGLPSSPPQKTPLLSRIGSVKKKWAVRKKRASSTPSEVEMQRGTEDDQPSRPNWFVRATSGSSSSKVHETYDVFDNNKHDAHQTPKASRTNTTRDNSDVPPLLPPFGTPSNPPNPSTPSNFTSPTTPSTPLTPSKLMKRKSFGFVQLKPRNKPINDVNHSVDPGPSTVSSPRPPPRNPNRLKRHSVNPSMTIPNMSSTSDLPSDLEAELQTGASASASCSSSSVDLHRNSNAEYTSGGSILRPSQSRHASYGGLGLGRAPQSTDNLDATARSRRRSFSKSSRTSQSQSRNRSKSRDGKRTAPTTATTINNGNADPSNEASQELDKESGSRSFMGSVRRISFVNSVGKQKNYKHKRTKSGVSLASVGDGIRKSLERRREASEDIASTIGTIDIDVNVTPPIPPLLPPIELSPPSPPRAGDTIDSRRRHPPPSAASSSSSVAGATSRPASSVHPTSSRPTPQPNSTPEPTSTSKPVTKPISPVSPLTASLGRSTIAPSIGGMGSLPGITSSTSMPAASASANVPRRNSLGDLKIPARISQAQVGLRRDLGMVKEFAGRVEQLKNLQMTYHNLVVEVQSILDAHHTQHAQQAAQSRAASPSSAPSPLGPSSSSPSSSTSPSAMNIFRPLSRIRSNTSSTISPSQSATSDSPVTSLAYPTPDSYPHPETYKHLAAAFYTINSRYKIAWECAELLIELGGGPSAEGESGSGSGLSESKSGAESVPNSPSPPGFPGFHGQAVQQEQQGQPSASISAPTALGYIGTSQIIPTSQAKKSRERAITLSGDESSSSKPGTPTPGASGSYATTYSSYTSSYGSAYGSTYSSYTSSTYASSHTSTFNTGASSAPNMSWRASTGRHDLNQRQLLLLREMLNGSDSSFVTENIQSTGDAGNTQYPHPSQPLPTSIQPVHHIHTYPGNSGQSQQSSPIKTSPPVLPALEEINRGWRWGEGMNSTITLPSEESSLPSGSGLDKLGGASINAKKRKSSRSSRLRGMSGLRDMLRSLTRNQHQNSNPDAMVPPSTTSLSTESSVEYQHRYPHGKVPGPGPGGVGSAYATHGRRRAKTSSGPDAGSSVRERDQERDREVRSTSPYTASSLSVKASPRRPSLASIFRIGTKEGRENKEKPPSSTISSLSVPNSGISPDHVSRGVAHARDGSGVGPPASHANGGSGTSGTSDEEDWDRLELEYPRQQQKTGSNTNPTSNVNPSSNTIRGRSPYMQQDAALPPVPPLPQQVPSSTSQTSLSLGSPVPVVPGVPARATRLSNVEENDHLDQPYHMSDDPRVSKTSLLNRTGSGSSPVQLRKSQKNLTGSVRSMPPQPLFVDNPRTSGQTNQLKLAMTPENIKPLLENAKEVHARLTDCIGEIRGLILPLGKDL
ncbi:hypothetical protein J3R30DRAFT_3401769 [Lentinula aciculospora]|uniref:Uncharacterized protein n=1 Tax=Lentinula aciculospora TaxID=153920 RepID=A0A9W9AM50_9AGAR|nr:hypothetical protein J3R30DRAFT_3401769 [Lentinula aciculospora]